MELISFIPQNAAYLIYYPKTFLLEETDDGIVSITSPETASNLTLSGYQFNQQVTEKILLDIHNDMIGKYEPYTDFRTLETNQDLFLERAYLKDEVYWVWWLLSKDNQIIIASINSENELSDEDYNLYRFMIDKMEIFSC
jgi:hypothetical protein